MNRQPSRFSSFWQGNALSRLARRWMAPLVGVVAAAAAPVALAVDLQVTELADTGYDPSPVGTVVHYTVSVANGAATSAAGSVTLFDLPAGTTLAAGAPSNCSAQPGSNGGTRVTCLNRSPLSASDGAQDFTLPVATQQHPVGTMTVYAAIGFAANAPAASTPLSSLPNNDPFYGGDTNPANNRLSQSTTLTEASDLALSKTATPDPVVGGGEITYTLSVTNHGPSSARGFTVTDSLDSNTSLVPGSAAGAGWNFNGADGTYAGTLAVGASASYSFKAKANVGSGTVTNGAVVATGAGEHPDTNPGNNSAEVVTQVTQGADLTLTKTASPVPATAGETVTFTLTARNLGPSNASNVQVTDPLPTGFTVVSVTPSQGTCIGVETVNCALGNMAKGDQMTIIIVAQVPLSASGQMSNVATISSDTPDPFDQGQDNQGRASFDVLADGADVSISKSKTKAVVPVWKPGQPLADSVWSSAITVSNAGPRAVTGDLQVVETLAIGEKWVDAGGNDLLPGTSVTIGNWSCSVNAAYAAATAQVVTCNMISGYPLARGNKVALTLHTLPLVAGELRNQVCTAGGGSSIAPKTDGGINRDPILSNNCAGAGARATDGYVDLKISKQTNGVGNLDNIVDISDDHVDFSITVSSSNDSAPTAGVVINDTLPGYAGGKLTVISQSDAGWSCVPDGGSLHCNSGNTVLQPGPSNAFTVVVRAARPWADSLTQAASACTENIAGRFCNTAGVGIDLSNPNAVGLTRSDDDSASDWFAVYPVTNVATTGKSISSGNPGRAGVETTYVIDYLNAGASDAAGVVMRDVFTLPADDAGFVLLSMQSTAPGSTCSVTAKDAAITATPASGGTSYANPSAAPATLTVSCLPIAMPAKQARNLTIKIRPNVDAGNTGRSFTNVADFFLDRDGDGVADAVSGVDANGIPFNHNSDLTDDSKDATLMFQAGSVDLSVEKEDTGFSGGVDPLGFDSRPGNNANNVLKYRIAVRNAGPSLATGAHILDTIQAPDGASIKLLGSQLGTLNAPTGAVVGINDAGSLCQIVAGGNPTALSGSQSIRCEMPSAGTNMVGNGQIAVGQTSYLYLVYEYLTAPPAYGATIVNAVEAVSNETETNLANNKAAQTTSIRTRSDLQVVKSMTTSAPDNDPSVAIAANTEAMLFQPLWYVLDITNLGPGHSRSVDRNGSSPLNGTGTVVTDVLEAGLELIAGEQVTWRKIDSLAPTGDNDLTAAGTGTCSQAGRTLTCQLGDLALDGRARVLIPARWVSLPAGGKGSNSVSLKTEQVDPSPGNDDSTVTNDIVVSSLAGRVFGDSDRSGSNGGIFQGAETGIPGVTVTLTGEDQWGNPVNKTTTTGSDGTYRFTDLAPAGTAGYTITQTQPADYANGPVNPPTSGADAPSSGGSYDRGGSSANSTYTGIALPGGTDGVRYDFPEVRRVSLSGVVYVDIDLNDVYGSGNDMPIAGATVELLNAADGSVIATTTTDATGAYRFIDQDPLIIYTLREVLPVGADAKPIYRNRPSAINPGTINGLACNPGGCVAGSGVSGDIATTDRISNIDLSAGFDGINFNFGEDVTTAISGRVYLDRDDSGKFTTGDAGLAGVTVTLTDASGTVIATTTTDAAGNYIFPDLLAGRDYRVVETQPNGLADGKENTTNTIAISNLPSTGSANNNFGELAASLAGMVYLDSNNNGVRDAGEPALAGVQVSLPAGTVDALGNTVTSATTAADGSYRFDDLLAGTYTVTEQAAQPLYNGTTTLNGVTTAGSIDGVSTGSATTVSTVPSNISGIVLPAGKHSVSNDFAEILPVAASGTVFFDVNNDGVMAGSAEAGIGGVEITLTGTDDLGNAVSLSTTTAADGTFSFDGLRPGTYTLTEPTQPAGTANGITTPGNVGGTSSGTATPVTTTPSAISSIDLTTPGSNSLDNLFGELPTNSGITGKVWEDRDNDGVIDPGEPGLPGVEVVLTGTDINGDPITPVTVVTDANGDYSFTDLPPGTYTVTETRQPTGTADGTTVPGSTGGTGSTPGSATDGNPSTITTITVGVGQISTDNNFGEIPVGAISGKVYNDSNDNGIAENDESGIANVVIELVGTDDLGNPVSLSTTTDADGNYRFDGLRPGTYTVTEPTQPAETLNGITTAGSIGGNSVGVATGKDTVPSSISQIVLPIGGDSIHNNFGEIGDSPDMLVSKSSATEKLTVNNIASYTISVRNGGQKPSVGEYVVEDRLPVGLSLAAVPAGEGWSCAAAVGDTRFSCRSTTVVNAGATAPATITVQAMVSAEAAKAGVVNNAVIVSGGGENEFRTPTKTERDAFEGTVTDLPVCDAAITQNACRVPTPVQLSASVGGTVWFDIGSDDTLLDGGDQRLPSWIVELVDPQTGTVVRTTTTAVDGSYTFTDVIPGKEWDIRFRDPVSNVVWAWPVNQETAAGTGVSCGVADAIANGTASACRNSNNGVSQLSVVLAPGEHLPQQSLPVDPSGVVYDAVSRDPVPGSIVTLTPVGMCAGYDPATAVLNAAAGGYNIQGNAISMTVGNNGYYQFVFGPAAPDRCEFSLSVTPPGGYQFVSTQITPENGSLNPPGGVGENWPVQPQPTAPTGPVGEGTRYWLTVISGSGTAGIIHNHIPLDTAAPAGLVITKTGDRQIVELGDTLQYTITVRQTAGSALSMVNIVDTLPRGFTYIDGTARLGGRALADPAGAPGPRLGFALGAINLGEQLALTYRVRVGVGALQGDGINRAQAHGCSINGGCISTESMSPVPGSIPSNQAQYRVRVTGGVFSTEACVLGKVFVDCNLNHVQDEEELGIPGVRLYFSDGTWLVSDVEGKYSYCGLPANSHTLKVDASTLPQGSRLTTSSNRNLGDADSLFLDLKNGELHRADFVEGSCSNPVLEQVKARRTQGEVRAPETEAGQPSLRFDSKPVRAPQQATDSANQRPIVQPRSIESVDASPEVQP